MSCSENGGIDLAYRSLVPKRCMLPLLFGAPNLAVLCCAALTQGFSAQKNATSRRYSYFIPVAALRGKPLEEFW